MAVHLKQHDCASASCSPVARRCDVAAVALMIFDETHETKGQTPELLLHVELRHVFLFQGQALRFTEETPGLSGLRGVALRARRAQLRFARIRLSLSHGFTGSTRGCAIPIQQRITATLPVSVSLSLSFFLSLLLLVSEPRRASIARASAGSKPSIALAWYLQVLCRPSIAGRLPYE